MARAPKKKAEAGRILSFFSGVARIEGLPHVFLHERIVDGAGATVAIVIGFDERSVEALFFDETFDLKQPVFRTGASVSLPVSDRLIGRVIDASGYPLDGLGPVNGDAWPVFRPAPQVIDRQPVSEPLSTGIKIIDINLPLGRGQRELIIGDRSLGKSTIAEDVVLNQKNLQSPVYCVYVLCGQKEQKLRDLISLFDQHNAFLYTTVVAATAGDSFAEQYLAPFVGCAIGEYFRDQGKHALVVYDDLSKHARTYRDISLLLGRAPGREAYPGDIFSLHAGLLERAAKLSGEKGGGSLTALPVVETLEGDITSYVSTNLISITDGQIYLEQSLFQKGFKPAVNVGLSVSRVGSRAQPQTVRDTVGGIRLALSQHKELQKLSQLESAVSKNTKARIRQGDLILEMLKQPKHTNVRPSEQTILFFALEQGWFDDLPIETWAGFEDLLLALLRSRYFELLDTITGGTFDAAAKDSVRAIIEDFKKEFVSQHA